MPTQSYSPTAAIARLRRLAPLVEAETVPGAGHDLACVQPGLVARRVLEFLDGRVPAGELASVPEPAVAAR